MYKVVVKRATLVSGTKVEDVAQEVEREVNRLIPSGWEPVGGIAVGHFEADEEPFLFQAMIRL